MTRADRIIITRFISGNLAAAGDGTFAAATRYNLGMTPKNGFVEAIYAANITQGGAAARFQFGKLSGAAWATHTELVAAVRPAAAVTPTSHTFSATINNRRVDAGNAISMTYTADGTTEAANAYFAVLIRLESP